MLLQRLLEAVPEAVVRGNAAIPILGITHDSRRVSRGFLYVAVKGARTDGNRFVPEAVARGAAAVASEDALPPGMGIACARVPDAREFLALATRAFFEDPASGMKLAAVTGTNGKTTTSCLIHSILAQSGRRSCLIGTLGMRIGDSRFASDYTTPEAPELTGFLRRALDAGCTHGVLEVSSHALASKRVFGTRFSTGLFTNLTPEHLDYHGDMESYFAAKRLLFSGSGRNRIETAVVNADDGYGRRLVEAAECPVIRYGRGPEAEVRLVSCRYRIDGADLQVATPLGAAALRSRLIGAPNVCNVLAAVGAAVAFNIDLHAIRQGIEAVAGVPGRMEPVDAGQDFSVIVDYAHTPDALEKLLQTVRELPHRRIITLFGCGGDRDRQKRPRMGAIAARLSSFVIATSDNPRSEDPLSILSEIEPGLREGPAPYRIEPDRRRAVAAAVAMAGEGDVVVIAGKGHEDYQIVADRVLSFDDRVVARELIRALRDRQAGEG